VESFKSESDEFLDLTDESKDIMEAERIKSLNEDYLKQHLTADQRAHREAISRMRTLFTDTRYIDN